MSHVVDNFPRVHKNILENATSIRKYFIKTNIQ